MGCLGPHSNSVDGQCDTVLCSQETVRLLVLFIGVAFTPERLTSERLVSQMVR